MRISSVMTAIGVAILLASFAGSPAHAQPAAADAEYLGITHEYILNKDGSTVYNYAHTLKMFTSYAFSRAYGESFVVYNPAWQSLKVTKSETTMRDGTKVKSPFNAYNEVLPGFAAGSAPHLGLREMVVTHTGLEKQCVVDFAYTVTTKAGMFPGLMGRVLMGERSPISKLTVRVKIPADRKLSWSALRFAAQPSETKDGGMRVYTWTVENVPMMPVETQQPPMDAYLPALYFSTSDNAALVKHALGDEDRLYALDGPTAAAASAMAGSAKSALEKALAFRAHVEQNVGSMSGELWHVGYRAQSAQETWKRNTGSILDRAVLLAALCKSAGIPAEPVLLGVPTEAAGFHPYTMAAVRLPKHDGLLLDPNAPQSTALPQKFAGASYLALTGRGSTGTLDAGDRNSVSLVSDWTLKDDRTIFGRSAATLEGVFAHSLDPKRSIAPLKRSLGSAGQGMKVSDEKSAHSGASTSAEAAVASLRPLTADAGLITVKLPALPGGIEDLHLNLGLSARETPVHLGVASTQSFKMTLHLPKGMRAVAVPSTVHLKNAAGEVRLVMKADAADVEIEKTLAVNHARVAPDLYGDLRALLVAWQSPEWGKLLLVDQK